MTQTLFTFLLFLPFLAPAQETVTFTTDTLGKGNVQLTTITTYLRPDSTIFETRSSVRFKNRQEARKHVIALFAEKIAADSVAIETARRHRAGLLASRQALLADLNRGNRSSEPGQPRLNPTVYPAEVPPGKQPLPTIKQVKPKKKKQ
jgi:hypothetical protein